MIGPSMPTLLMASTIFRCFASDCSIHRGSEPRHREGGTGEREREDQARAGRALRRLTKTTTRTGQSGRVGPCWHIGTLATAHWPVARFDMPTDHGHEGLQAKILSPIDDLHSARGGSVQLECIRRAGGTTPLPQTTPHPRRHGGYTP